MVCGHMLSQDSGSNSCFSFKMFSFPSFEINIIISFPFFLSPFQALMFLGSFSVKQGFQGIFLESPVYCLGPVLRGEGARSLYSTAEIKTSVA